MLILCCGPDSYRATQRAKELEDAFRGKHNPDASSIERLEGGRHLAENVIEKCFTGSLFSPMRLIRADGLIETCVKANVKALVHALSVDPDRIIVVSIEREKPTGADLKPFADVPKLLVNDYPLLGGRDFSAWVSRSGEALGVKDSSVLARLAEACAGDAWLASNELTKLAAGGHSELTLSRSNNGYAMADALLEKNPERYRSLFERSFIDKTTYMILQQSQSAIRVQDGDVKGVPPFAIGKLRNADGRRARALTSTSLMMTILSRSGLATTEELATLLP